ncbi:MAG: FadR family transcriptional regulator [Proteobacteria bacterium]|nr:FadR family transcriptional regulator [Pseudomonadota bacterium]MBU1581751.1 FadR family transcriptional regulator [Pseudomonadota bacterium]MBU2454024.1 FadR family transcriptional regulator [Pseudomonadota bacterium]MBU2628679.1 FadR family transcriptional regulator [Pseudomonadota bacterium]
MTLSIKPIKPKRISDLVFDQIRELIFRGKLKPGEKMMTERELAELMNVSRTTVRDAIQRLVAIGLIVQKHGQGTFVGTYDAGPKNPIIKAIEDQDTTLEDLLEVRMGLECNAAALAALRADETDINAMRQCIEEMEKEIRSNRLGTEADASFHMAIAYASKNPLHILIMRNFHDYLLHGIRENLSSLYKKPENIEIILKQHRNILDVITSRDPEKAYTAMQNHISFVLDFFKNMSE